MSLALALAVSTVLILPLALGQDTTNPNCTTTGSGKTYDYIVIGSGAGGIPIADLLSEAGHSVLLIEKGLPSTGRWNGTMKPVWLEGTNLTRFDVPGLDMQKYVEKAWQRIPGTYVPSVDGKLYLQQGLDTVSKALDKAGFKYVVPNVHPDEKNFTYGHSTFFLENTERHCPLATYLVTAAKRGNFNLWTNAMPRRLVRKSGHITGVELECSNNGTVGPGFSGVINVTPDTGRVILSAGTFGSPKLLFRSGIGPKDQLETVQNSTIDGRTMVGSDQSIDLPVGYNLNDHVGTDIQIAHPDIFFYDFYGAWDEPIQSDVDEYLNNRIGILTQVAPNLGPIAWQQITGSDGVVRHIQWQARVEGRSKTSMTITQYLGTGTKPRGRMTILPNLNARVAIPPYLRDEGDKEVVIQGIEYMRGELSEVRNLTWIVPSVSQNSTAFVNSIPALPGSRGSNHWTGSCMIGTDDGRTEGRAVFDLDTKDASIFPGMVTGNPSGAIVAVAEYAAERILALKT
ncbi:FAD-linked reductase [Lojkania enalia]|uniref:FAD-linked reductase n=1 Tax=Lojkania enalia TaxID=147567 RepID=A0A9P4N884_9PLEO|nr:FAD-linked reductase [Didymosphaeria enalia]